mmetsp:Transcript_38994/g.59328  ORF Transcript_38994/g.59328 Transcript_38994/m.59328 type:complete len:95 (+) Transcript_38994:4131-4415(+)
MTLPGRELDVVEEDIQEKNLDTNPRHHMTVEPDFSRQTHDVYQDSNLQGKQSVCSSSKQGSSTSRIDKGGLKPKGSKFITRQPASHNHTLQVHD